MSEVISIPTIEQINLEHQLANSKANEAVQHATNCGLMLLQVKASLNHGEWLPWLNGEIESGRLKVEKRQAQRYMRLGSNASCMTYLEPKSINAALELLTDKDPEEQQASLIYVEAERKAREEAEAKAESERQAREIAEQRSKEFSIESNDRRKKIDELQSKVIELEKRKPEVITKTPDDYETIKIQCSNLVTEINRIKDQQSKLINDQVKSKLQGYQSEIDDMERKKSIMQEQVDRMKEYMASLNSESKRLEVHKDVIEKSRLHLISLAAFISDSDEMNDKDTRDRWLRLSNMHNDAHKAILSYLGLGDNLNQLVS